MLKSVTFQKDLGSYFDKTLRVQRLGSLISETIRSAGGTVRPGIVFKAGLLSKTDLTTELVKEFTELQGIIGGLYAQRAGTRSHHAGGEPQRYRRGHLRPLQAGVDGRRRAAQH